MIGIIGQTFGTASVRLLRPLDIQLPHSYQMEYNNPDGEGTFSGVTHQNYYTIPLCFALEREDNFSTAVYKYTIFSQ